MKVNNIQPDNRYYFDINKVTNLKKFRFYDMNKYIESFNVMLDKVEGGFNFVTQNWVKASLEISHKQRTIIEIVKFLTVAEIYKFEYVYILEGTYKGETKYKIGKAKSIKDRIKLFGVKIPFDIKVIASFYVKDAIKLESYLHKHFKSKRLSGEWFDLNNIDFMEIFKIGSNREIKEYYECVEDFAEQHRKKEWKSDKDYIDYLESMLVFNNISFEARI